MLPAAHRMRLSRDFTDVVRNGARSGRPSLVVHCSPPDPAGHDGAPPLAGFIVSRAVGGAVQRNRVKRRLRHIVASHLDRLPPGTRIVVRALPRAAEASFAELAGDLDRAMRRLEPRLTAARSSR
ncbi:MAG: ribonuclease P protein component [Actinomycetes bacterium]